MSRPIARCEAIAAHLKLLYPEDMDCIILAGSGFRAGIALRLRPNAKHQPFADFTIQQRSLCAVPCCGRKLQVLWMLRTQHALVAKDAVQNTAYRSSKTRFVALSPHCHSSAAVARGRHIAHGVLHTLRHHQYAFTGRRAQQLYSDGKQPRLDRVTPQPACAAGSTAAPGRTGCQRGSCAARSRAAGAAAAAAATPAAPAVSPAAAAGASRTL